MTSRFRAVSQEAVGLSNSGSPTRNLNQSDTGVVLPLEHGSSTVHRTDTAMPIQLDSSRCRILPHAKVSALHVQERSLFNRRRFVEEVDKKEKRTFCRTWCDMWFLLAKSRVSCVILSTFLFGGGLLIILLTVFGGLTSCPELTGAVVFLILTASLSIVLGCLCCCYHWVENNDDLPFGIFCVAYCLLLLFISVTISGTVVVFTRIHPIGPDQPPPEILLKNNTGSETVPNFSSCGMIELPLGILIICYFCSITFLIISYCACILAFGARHAND